MDNQTRELMFSSEKQDFETPDDFFEQYQKKYNITIDVAATKENTKCVNFISPEQNLFETIYTETGWLNPPYQKPEKPCKSKCKKKKCAKRAFHIAEYIPGQIDFIERVVFMAKNHGATTVCLIPVRTDTDLFHRFIWDKENQCPREFVKELTFLEGRLVFKGEKNPAPFPSMIVVFGKK